MLFVFCCGTMVGLGVHICALGLYAHCYLILTVDMGYSYVALCHEVWRRLRFVYGLSRWKSFWLFSKGAEYMYYAARKKYLED